MTVSDVALPSGSPAADADRARVRARARVRLATAERDGNVVAMPGVTPAADGSTWAAGRAGAAAKDAAGAVWADLAGAWPWRNVPPSLRQLWAQRIPARERVPGRCESAGSIALWWGWTGWNHLALVITVVGYALIWTQQHPARALPTDITAAALIGMWLT